MEGISRSKTTMKLILQDNNVDTSRGVGGIVFTIIVDVFLLLVEIIGRVSSSKSYISDLEAFASRTNCKCRGFLHLFDLFQ